MKKGKRIFALLLAMVMVLAMSATVFADNDETDGDSSNTITITVTGAADGETYKAYKIFDVTYDEKSGTYTYTITNNSDWFDAVKAVSNLDEDESDTDYFVLTVLSTDDDNVITYVVTAVSGTSGEDVAKYFASFTSEGGAGGNDVIDDDKTATASNETAAFSGMSEGYYLITSSLGSYLMLDTVVDETEIKEKNGEPSITKVIDDESDDGTKSASYSIGDTVEFVITIGAKDGAAAYKVVDTLSAGLTYTSGSLKICEGDDGLTENNEYTLTVGEYDKDSGTEITITFDAAYLDTLGDGDTITITYSATVNSNALTGVDSSVTSPEYAGNNTNRVVLYYGGKSSVEDVVYISTFEFTLKKTDENGNVIGVKDGKYATFSLTSGSDSDTVTYYFTYDSNSKKYTVTSSSTSGATKDIEVKGDDGEVTVYGLAAGTYTLTETAAPTGYNILTGTITITIGDDGTVEIEDGTASDGTITVVNTSGSELPFTGGMGTTILYIAGIALVLFAGIMLVTRRRMSREA